MICLTKQISIMRAPQPVAISSKTIISAAFKDVAASRRKLTQNSMSPNHACMLKPTF